MDKAVPQDVLTKACRAVRMVLHLCPDPLPRTVVDAIEGGRRPSDEICNRLSAAGSRLGGTTAYHVVAAAGALIDLWDYPARARDPQARTRAVAEAVAEALAGAVADVLGPAADATTGDAYSERDDVVQRAHALGAKWAMEWLNRQEVRCPYCHQAGHSTEEACPEMDPQTYRQAIGALPTCEDER